MRTDFQTRFCELLDSLPGTDTDAANKLGVSKQRVSSWRNGERSPRQPMIAKIAETFNVNVAWLMGLDAPREIKEPDINNFDYEAHGVAIRETRKPTLSTTQPDIDEMIEYLNKMKQLRELAPDEQDMLELYRHLPPEARDAMKRFAKSYLKDDELE